MKTFKKILSVFLIFLMLITAVPLSSIIEIKLPIFDFAIRASAKVVPSRGSCGENVSYTYNRLTGEVVISGTGPMMNYEYDASPFHNSDIKNVIIKDGVTTIGEFVFRYCSKLENVIIPDSVTTIEYMAFQYCDSLTNITIPESVTTIDGYAFYWCSSLKSITIPGSVTDIAYNTFEGCDSLTTVIIGDGVMSIGADAFCDCVSLTDIRIPESIISIERSAFWNTGYYNDITNWENNVLYIGKYLIDAKNTLSGSYTIKDGTKGIANSAMIYCPELTDLIIPDSVEFIGSYSFENCDNLISVTIGDGVATIGNHAFRWCDRLANVKIGANVTSIGDYVFDLCKNLTNIKIPDSVTYLGVMPFSATGYSLNKSNWEGEVLYIDKFLLTANANLSGSYTVKEGTKVVANGAFEECTNLVDVVLPDSVIAIGNHAFEDCSSLENILIGNGVKSIGEMAFYNCRGLSGVTIPDSVKTIGDHAFYGCSNLKRIIIPDSVTFIGNSVFGNCYNLTNITVGIGNSAYSSDSTGVLFDKNKTVLLKYPVGNTNVSYTIPDGVTTIGDLSFYDCINLKNITIPKSVISIGDGAFCGCDNIKNVYYNGDKNQWEFITVGLDNDPLSKNSINFFGGCNCNCHKDGIKGLFYKIILFFQKLFRLNRICKGCGISHY